LEKEMSEYVTDPEILKQLQGSSGPAESEYVTDPAVLAQLNGTAALGETAPPPEGSIGGSLAQTAMSAGTNVGAIGINPQAMMNVAKPIIQGAKEVYSGPMGVVRGVADATMMAHGIPPLAGGYGAAENLAKRYDAAKGAISEASKGLSQSEIVTSAKTGSQYPATVPEYYKMQKAAPELSAKLSDLYNNKGGSNAVRSWLQSSEAAPYMNNPAFREAAEGYIGKVPGAMAQLGKVVGPVARGVAKAAGPVGIGMNLYDAGQMARQTQLGERLQQGQGQMAEQAFRNGPVQSYQGPQLQPQEAQNVLQSGSPRDIKYFGGRDQLTEMIRKKAAEKVLGPVAPGSF